MPRKILIVEDEEETLRILEKRLGDRGFQIYTATTADEALDQARKCLPDIILMDILLPYNTDGSEVVKILSLDSSTKDIPVLFLSGIITKENGRIAKLTIGNKHYPAIPKPFVFKELLGEINRLIE